MSSSRVSGLKLWSYVGTLVLMTGGFTACREGNEESSGPGASTGGDSNTGGTDGGETDPAGGASGGGATGSGGKEASGGAGPGGSAGTNACDPDPCGNGKCIEDAANYTCDCDEAWYGDLCDQTCDDGDDATTDWHAPELGCAHRILDWSVFDSGLQFDHSSGLAWWRVPGFVSYVDVETKCGELSEAGHSDWRVPTIDETRTWGAGCEDTAPGGICPISDSTCLATECGYGKAGDCSSCRGGDGPHASGTYCRPEIPTCLNLWTSSVCSDCESLEVWFYGQSNGNFFSDEPTGGRILECTTEFADL